MDRKEFAIECMKKLDMMYSCIDAFKNGKLWMSTGGGVMSGILFEATPEMFVKAKELEADGTRTVWHVINGHYILGGTDSVEMNTYLIVVDEDVPPEFSDNGQEAECFAYVENVTDPQLSEYGYVVVQGCNGGLRRTH